MAVFRLTEILQNATFVEELPAKRNTRNQKQFEKLLVMQYQNIKLTVGLQRSNQNLVQYCITVPQESKKQSHQLMFERWLVDLGLETTLMSHKGCHPFCEFP